MDDLVALLKTENDYLREQVAFLEQALGAFFQPPVEWGLSPQETRLFGILFSRKLVTKSAAMAALYQGIGNDEPEIRIIDVFICKIRKKLKPFGVSIETSWGQGYYLTETARAAVKSQMEAING